MVEGQSTTNFTTRKKIPYVIFTYEVITRKPVLPSF